MTRATAVETTAIIGGRRHAIVLSFERVVAFVGGPEEDGPDATLVFTDGGPDYFVVAVPYGTFASAYHQWLTGEVDSGIQAFAPQEDEDGVEATIAALGLRGQEAVPDERRAAGSG